MTPEHDNDDAHLVERWLKSTLAYDGSFLKVRHDEVMLPGAGGAATREYVVHPGAVVVVPLLDDGRLVMCRQYRYPLQRVMLEFPAGKIDPGEDRALCAARELAEETGYSAREWARAGVLHNAAAYSDEFIEIWFARGLRAGAQALDHGEHIDVHLVPESELDARCGNGEVTDAKTLIGLQWLQRWRAGAWPMTWKAAGQGAAG